MHCLLLMRRSHRLFVLLLWVYQFNITYNHFVTPFEESSYICNLLEQCYFTGSLTSTDYVGRMIFRPSQELNQFEDRT
jgi:hypothetical protein